MNGTITITYGGAEVNAKIAAQTLGLVPYVTLDGSVEWQCGGAPVPATGGAVIMPGAAAGGVGTLAGAAFVKYLPASCRT